MLIYLDLETTGIKFDDKLCSIAILHDNVAMYSLVNEGKKIHFEASSTHHITNEMLKNAKKFSETDIYNFLKKNNTLKNCIIAHDSNFHKEKLSLGGLEWMGSFVDTQRVTKHLLPECVSFSLQSLRYELKLYREEEKLYKEYGIKDALHAHHALSDAMVVQSLFTSLHEMRSVEDMQELSCQKVLLQRFTFGKYKGKYIEEILMHDRGYLQWLFSSAKDIDEDMLYTLEYYLQGQ